MELLQYFTMPSLHVRFRDKLDALAVNVESWFHKTMGVLKTQWYAMPFATTLITLITLQNRYTYCIHSELFFTWKYLGVLYFLMSARFVIKMRLFDALILTISFAEMQSKLVANSDKSRYDNIMFIWHYSYRNILVNNFITGNVQ